MFGYHFSSVVFFIFQLVGTFGSPKRPCIFLYNFYCIKSEMIPGMRCIQGHWEKYTWISFFFERLKISFGLQLFIYYFYWKNIHVRPVLILSIPYLQSKLLKLCTHWKFLWIFGGFLISLEWNPEHFATTVYMFSFSRWSILLPLLLIKKICHWH